ncbi:MAG: hypothetical protein JNJ61_09805 [Anaerolineae bacterium]|nr:hypothetical protein [Anaerolineae bacterium]
MTDTVMKPSDMLPLTPAVFHILLVLADGDLHIVGPSLPPETAKGCTFTFASCGG